MKRFIIRNNDSYLIECESETTEGIYQYFENTIDETINGYTVEDREDDSRIDGYEFISAFKDGECPGDLQFF